MRAPAVACMLPPADGYPGGFEGLEGLEGWHFVFSPLLVLEERRRSEGLKEELRWPQAAAALLVLG